MTCRTTRLARRALAAPRSGSPAHGDPSLRESAAADSSLPHLHRDWAHRCHICTGIGPTPAPGLGVREPPKSRAIGPSGRKDGTAVSCQSVQCLHARECVGRLLDALEVDERHRAHLWPEGFRTACAATVRWIERQPEATPEPDRLRRGLRGTWMENGGRRALAAVFFFRSSMNPGCSLKIVTSCRAVGSVLRFVTATRS